MATTLERASFANQAGGRVNLTLVSTAGINVGDTMTVTVGSGQSAGATLTGTVKKFIGSTGIKLGVTVVSKPSGLLLLPKGSPIA
jgi:hypothetical protein